MNKINEAILKTIVYADIFDYPLILEEVRHYFIEFKIQNSKCKIAIQNSKLIEEKDGYYFLFGRKKIVALRKKREKWSREKLKIAAKAASWLKLIPWIKMVGITGSLAMNNSDQNDDLDLLIISSKKRIWLTRFLATILMELLGKRRHPGAYHPERAERVEGSMPKAARASLDSSTPLGMTSSYKDKICLNMYLDMNHLQVPKKERDLFTAHEVVQVKPLWDKDQTYQKFLAENLWVKKYLPNALVIARSVGAKQFHRPIVILNLFQNPLRLPRSLWSLVMTMMENFVRNFQLWYMRSRRTTEVISDGIIRFHPKDARKWVLEKYKRKLSRLEIAT